MSDVSEHASAPQWEGHPIAFHVWPNQSSIEVLWWDELGTADTPVHQWLGEEFGRVRGVDSVTVRRYEAVLHCVPRVEAMEYIVSDVLELLCEDPNLAYLVRQQLKAPPGREISVWLAGDRVGPR